MPDDARPPVWIGHTFMRSNVLEASREFLTVLGLRPIAQGEDFAVFELRGGTHLVLLPAQETLPETAPFDLMVEDLEATHARLAGLGLAPTPISAGKVHRCFSVRDPSGQAIPFNSSHVSGPV